MWVVAHLKYFSFRYIVNPELQNLECNRSVDHRYGRGALMELKRGSRMSSSLSTYPQSTEVKLCGFGGSKFEMGLQEFP